MDIKSHRLIVPDVLHSPKFEGW